MLRCLGPYGRRTPCKGTAVSMLVGAAAPSSFSCGISTFAARLPNNGLSMPGTVFIPDGLGFRDAHGLVVAGGLTATANKDDVLTSVRSMGEVYIYARDGSSFSTMNPLLQKRHNFGLVRHGNFLYALGGLQSNWPGKEGVGGLRSVERFDLTQGTTGKWTAMRDLQTARWDMGVVALGDGTIMLIGGMTPLEPHDHHRSRTDDTTELYKVDMNGNFVQEGSGIASYRFPDPTTGPGACVVASGVRQGTVIVAGGTSPGLGETDAVWSLTPGGNSWVLEPRLSRARASLQIMDASHLRCSSGSGSIFVFGGLAVSADRQDTVTPMNVEELNVEQPGKISMAKPDIIYDRNMFGIASDTSSGKTYLVGGDGEWQKPDGSSSTISMYG